MQDFEYTKGWFWFFCFGRKNWWFIVLVTDVIFGWELLKTLTICRMYMFCNFCEIWGQFSFIAFAIIIFYFGRPFDNNHDMEMNYADDQNAKPHVILSLAYDGWMGKFNQHHFYSSKCPITMDNQHKNDSTCACGTRRN